MNWVALADALVEVGAKRISIAAGYYRPSWIAASVDFFASTGFDVMWSGDIIDQGLVADEAEKLEIEAATRWDYPNQIVQGACIGAAEAAPDCDAICQIGAGMRTSYVVAEVEAQTGKPLVATDLAAHWAVMRAARLRSASSVVLRLPAPLSGIQRRANPLPTTRYRSRVLDAISKPLARRHPYLTPAHPG